MTIILFQKFKPVLLLCWTSKNVDHFLYCACLCTLLSFTVSTGKNTKSEASIYPMLVNSSVQTPVCECLVSCGGDGVPCSGARLPWGWWKLWAYRDQVWTLGMKGSCSPHDSHIVEDKGCNSGRPYVTEVVVLLVLVSRSHPDGYSAVLI